MFALAGEGMTREAIAAPLKAAQSGRRSPDRSSDLKPSIHSVSACEPRPSAASIAALNPRNAWSLDMTPSVRRCSARSARKPAKAWLKSPRSTQMSARCFAQVRCSSPALHLANFRVPPAARRQM